MPADAGSGCWGRGRPLILLPFANHLLTQGRPSYVTVCYAARINRPPVLSNSHQDHVSSCLLVGRTSDIPATLRLSIGVQRLSRVCRMGRLAWELESPA